MDANEMPKITEPKDQLDALETIKSVEMMRYALDETKFQLKWMQAIIHCMQVLGKIHSDLVFRLPAEVIERERAKQMPSAPIKPEVA